MDMDEISPFGDIMLTVKTATGNGTFRVSSHVLMGASAFFRSMLHHTSQFQEETQFRQHVGPDPFDLEVVLEDQTLEACETILRCIHGKNIPMPEQLNGGHLAELYQLAILAQYWDCGKALEGWIAFVIPNLVGENGDYTGRAADVDRWLLIAVVFSHEHLFRSTTYYCLQYGSLDARESFAVYDLGGEGHSLTVVGRHPFNCSSQRVISES